MLCNLSILKMRKHAQWAAHLDGWVGLSGVVTLLSGDAARWTSLTLVPKPHPPLLWLLDDLYEGGWCCYVEARGVKEMWINCSVPGTQKTQHLDDETPAFSAALNLCINAKVTQYQCQYLPIPVVTYEQPALTISTDLYRMLIIYGKQRLTWVEWAQVPSIAACDGQKTKTDVWLTEVKVLEWLVDYHLHYMTYST